MTITSTEKPGTPVVAINDIGTAEDFLAAVDATIKYFNDVGSSRVDLQACKLEYSIVSPK